MDEMNRNNYRELCLEKIKQIESKKSKKGRLSVNMQKNIAHYKKIANMSYSEYVEMETRQEEEYQAYLAELRKQFVITEEQAKLIFDRFDAWLEKYKNDIEHLEEEYHTGHCFSEPWFCGDYAPHAEAEFYEHLFDGSIYWSVGKDHPVFYSCRVRIAERIKEIKNLTNLEQ